MKTIIHHSNTRGYANQGWLKSFHSFSFANYYNPDRMNFGALRVLNDDLVSGGGGFPSHPHHNMEIISIPLFGDLEHQDNMGNKTVIKEGDIQVMSAGTGVIHSEYNKNKSKEVQFLQIWVYPKVKNVKPRYDQRSISSLKVENDLYQILSPDQNDKGVWIHQDAWFFMGEFSDQKTLQYQLKDPANGVYIFVLEGKIEIEENTLLKRDGIGISETEEIEIEFRKGSKILLMEVPMDKKIITN